MTHQPAIDGAVAGHDAVPRDPVVGHPELGGPVLDEHVPLLERAVVEQQVEAFPGRELPFLVLGRDPALAAAESCLRALVAQPFDNVFHEIPQCGRSRAF
jgi:hypothetical protein